MIEGQNILSVSLPLCTKEAFLVKFFLVTGNQANMAALGSTLVSPTRSMFKNQTSAGVAIPLPIASVHRGL